MFQLFVGITAFAALLSYLNKKTLKLPDTIGILVLTIIAVSIFGIYGYFDDEGFKSVCHVVTQIDFKTILFDFLLGILLFAGAIHVNLKSLLNLKAPVLIYATFGVVVSTFIIGSAIYYTSQLFGVQISYIYCLVFGSIISPTDPVAVLALLKKAGAPKDIELKIIGESLFNDGVGIVVFLSLLGLTTMNSEIHLSHIALEFLKEAGGGVIMGIILGFMGKFFINRIIKNPSIAVHITLAIVLGGYSLSSLIHVSGAIAMVVAGLIVGYSIHQNHISDNLRNHLNVFWGALDDIFNAVLFVLIGLEVVAFNFNFNNILLGLIAIVVVLFSRYLVIWIANVFLKSKNRAKPKDLKVLTWAGLRGGISIALALSLPDGEIKEILLVLTYIVVVFSIIVQGLTIERLVKKTYFGNQNKD